MTRKEVVLLEWARGAFARLGPRALKRMQDIVLHDQLPASQSPKDGGDQEVPTQTLRGIDRFFRRIEANDGEAAFWSLRKIDCADPTEPRRTIVPAEVCAGDVLFRNDYHVFPTHVFASLKRAVTCWQKRYVDCFGRRVPAVGWPFPSTLCQVVSFFWMLSEWILERLRLLSRVPDPRLGQSILAGKKRKLHAVVKDDEDAPKSKVREIYVYDYPAYLAAPPVEGASPERPQDPLPALVASADVVQQFYADMVDRLLFQDVVPADGELVVELELLDLPLLLPPPGAARLGFSDASVEEDDDLALLPDLPFASAMVKKKKLKRPPTVAAADGSIAPRPDMFSEPSGPVFLTDIDGLPLFLLDRDTPIIAHCPDNVQPRPVEATVSDSIDLPSLESDIMLD